VPIPRTPHRNPRRKPFTRDTLAGTMLSA
jgi:hypothetical protein